MGHGEDMIEYVADRPGHDRRYALDASKLKRELGWRPTRSAWPEALESTIQWYVDNPPWWRPLQERAALGQARTSRGNA
jgi:dTDP-glucose 4,6-dehydratase